MRFIGFGRATLGNKTVAADTTDSPVNSTITATAGTNTSQLETGLTIADGSFLFLHQTQGVGAADRNEIIQVNHYNSGTGVCTFNTNLVYTYSTGAQAVVIQEVQDLTNNANFYTTSWNGSKGAIMFYLCKGVFTNNATINGDGRGFRGPSGVGGNRNTGRRGEGTGGNDQSQNVGGFGSLQAQGNGGGGGGWSDNYPWNQGNGGGGGSNATQDGSGGYITGGGNNAGGGGGNFGLSVGAVNLSSISLGGAGGSGGAGDYSGTTGFGGTGGSIIIIIAQTWINNGTIVSRGTSGGYADYHGGGGGSGAGGSVFGLGVNMKVGTILCNGGPRVKAGGHPNDFGDEDGGSGGVGRIRLECCTLANPGTTYPTASIVVGGAPYCGTAVQII